MDTKLKDSPAVGPSVPVQPVGPSPSKFDYTNYNVPGITVAMLDAMAMSIFNTPTTNIFTSIILFIKLAIAVAYIWARTKLVNIQALIYSQQYQQNQTNDANNSLNGDNLDGGLPKP